MTAIPPRFAIFGLLCVAWATAMLFSDASIVHAAGAAWFLHWTIQISVTLVSWAHPFALPDRYYQPWRSTAHGRIPRLYGLWIFERVVRRINPFSLDRRAFATLDAATRAAETTHAVSFAIESMLTVGLAVAGSTATAGFLVLWNVILNLYAVALQRYNRARIRHLAQRRAGRTPSERPSADPRLRDRRSAAVSSSP